MSLQKRSWSVSALAVEFGLDRRTIAKRLDQDGVQPISASGSPTYRLQDVLDVLRQREAEPDRARTRADEGHDSATMALRSAFVFCKPAALVLIRHTRLSPEEVLQLVPRLLAAFETMADEVLGRTKLLKHLPIELHDSEGRGALLKLLKTTARPINLQRKSYTTPRVHDCMR